ncbi:hypothetical protein AA313_de0200647 [Arthrobotrys entomopaga]|nr:hypothetical protein AA313_de0200647 [Arthrobotrys entomopaga]
MFKGLDSIGEIFQGKNSSTERRSAPATQEGEQPQYKVITINDLPKLSPATTPGLSRSNMVPSTPALVNQQMTLSQGPRRSIPEESYVVPPSPDGLQSYAASIVSPSTPKVNRVDYTWDTKGDALAPPVPQQATNPFQSKDDFEQRSPSDDGMTRYDTKSFFNYYADDGKSEYGNQSFFNYYTEEQGGSNIPAVPVPPIPTNPYEGMRRNQSSKATKSPTTTTGPPLRTNMLDLGAWSPTSRFSSNPFGNSPTDQYPAGYGYGYGYEAGDDVSPVSATEPVSQDIRYSDCGVNPFQGLDEEARKERDSGAVGDIWNMITGTARQVDIEKPQQPTQATVVSPKIQLDQSALSPPKTESTRLRSLTDFQIPVGAGAIISPPAASPSEWFKDILIHYEGRPAGIARALSYFPQPASPHPPGLSPPEITSMAVPYLADIENELKELQRARDNPRAEVQVKQVQQERDRVRELIQRQLAYDQAIGALEQATGGKRLTKEQLDPSKIWEQIDLSGARKMSIDERLPTERDQVQEREQPRSEERNRGQSYMTVVGFEDRTSSIPPVPRIPSVLAQAQPPKEPLRTMMPSGDFFNRKPSTVEQVSPVSPEEKEVPFVLDTRSEMSSKVKSFSEDSPVYNQYLQAQPSPAAYSDNSPTNGSEASGFKWSLAKSDYDEKFPSPAPRAHMRNESAHTVSEPPPYSSPNMNNRTMDAQRFSRLSEEDPIQSGRRFPVRGSDLPRLATASSGNQQAQLSPQPNVLSYMQFTPTTPHRSRYSTADDRERGPRAHIGLGDIGFRTSDPRDRAEKKRQRQEKRERLFKRGGSLWFCGFCCGVQKMTRKHKIFWWGVFIFAIILATILGVVLAMKKSNQVKPVESEEPFNLIRLPNLPAVPADPIKVTPRLVNTVNTCIAPSTIWSCQLPPPLASNQNPNQPVFNWKIIALNGTTTIIDPNPILPTVDDYKNFSMIDGIVAAPSEGEATSLFISLLAGDEAASPSATANSENPAQGKRIVKRFHHRHFPRAVTPTSSTTIRNTVTTIETPAATLSAPAGGGAATQTLPSAAVLPTAYSGQQLRFFDRGLPTEHYEFIMHFQKQIYLKSIDNNATSTSDPADANGGVTPSEANFVCVWPQTRYIAKIFTRPNEVSQGATKQIVDPNTLKVQKGDNAGGFLGYGVQVDEDIANYDIDGTGFISCYPIDSLGNIDVVNMQKKVIVQGINTGESKVNYRGCQCSWTNFQSDSS